MNLRHQVLRGNDRLSPSYARYYNMAPYYNGKSWKGTHSGYSFHPADYGLEYPEYELHAGVAAHVPEHEEHLSHQYYHPHTEHIDHSDEKDWSWSKDKGKEKEKEKSSAGKRSKNSTPLTALTLLAFFFFLNLLQSCIKDHMDAINPTAMVLTPQINRKRFTKAKTNPREESIVSAASESFDIESVIDEDVIEINNNTEPYFIDDRIEAYNNNNTRLFASKEEKWKKEFNLVQFKPQYLNDSFVIQVKNPLIHHSTNLMPYLHTQQQSSNQGRIFQKISPLPADFTKSTEESNKFIEKVNPTSTRTQWAAVSLYTHHLNP